MNHSPKKRWIWAGALSVLLALFAALVVVTPAKAATTKTTAAEVATAVNAGFTGIQPASATNDTTVTLSGYSNIAASDNIAITLQGGANLTLDLGGLCVNMSGETLAVNGEGTLTITNGTITGSVPATAAWSSVLAVGSEGNSSKLTVNLNGATVSNPETSTPNANTDGVVNVTGGATLNVNTGSTIANNATASSAGASPCVVVGNGTESLTTKSGTLNLAGGTIINNEGGTCVRVCQGSTASLNSGTVTVTPLGVNAGSNTYQTGIVVGASNETASTLTVNGATVNGTVGIFGGSTASMKSGSINVTGKLAEGSDLYVPAVQIGSSNVATGSGTFNMTGGTIESTGVGVQAVSTVEESLTGLPAISLNGGTINVTGESNESDTPSVPTGVYVSNSTGNDEANVTISGNTTVNVTNTTPNGTANALDVQEGNVAIKSNNKGTPSLIGAINTASKVGLTIPSGITVQTPINASDLVASKLSAMVVTPGETPTYTYYSAKAAPANAIKLNFTNEANPVAILTVGFEHNADAALDAIVSTANSLGKNITAEQVKTLGGTPVNDTMYMFFYGDAGADYNLGFGQVAGSATTQVNEKTNTGTSTPVIGVTFFAFEGPGEYTDGSDNWANAQVSPSKYTVVVAKANTFTKGGSWPSATTDFYASQSVQLAGVVYTYLNGNEANTASNLELVGTYVTNDDGEEVLSPVSPVNPIDVVENPTAAAEVKPKAPITADAGVFSGWFQTQSATSSQYVPSTATSFTPTLGEEPVYALNLVAGYVNPNDLTGTATLSPTTQNVIQGQTYSFTYTYTLSTPTKAPSITLANKGTIASGQSAASSAIQQVAAKSALESAFSKASIGTTVSFSSTSNITASDAVVTNNGNVFTVTFDVAVGSTAKATSTTPVTMTVAPATPKLSAGAKAPTAKLNVFEVVPGVSTQGSGTVAQNTTDGKTYTLTATPAAGWEFVQWQTKYGTVISSANPLTLSLSAAKNYGTIIAVFQQTSGVDVYRLYNPYTYEHLYTTSETEANNLDDAGWENEGIAWVAPEHSSVAIYRLYNKWNGDHMYTTSIAEYSSLQKNGWTGEGEAMYSAPEGDVTIYRLYNPYMTENAGAFSHLWTADVTEYERLSSVGWTKEGTAWWAISAPGM